MRFHGAVGYMRPELVRPGVYEEKIIERTYFGDIVQNLVKASEGEHLHLNLRHQSIVSVVADAFLYEHYGAIRYVRWKGATWAVTNVDISKPPRIELRLGVLYVGPTAETPSDAP